MLPNPKTIEFDQNYLSITWDDGQLCKYALSHLRRECPCAHCQKSQATFSQQQIAAFDVIQALKWEPIGHYAMRIHWSDGHRNGLYTFDYLWDLRQKAEAYYAAHPPLDETSRAMILAAQKAANQGGCGSGGCGCSHTKTTHHHHNH